MFVKASVLACAAMIIPVGGLIMAAMLLWEVCKYTLRKLR